MSLQWQTDIATVERVYALDWLLKGIFDRQVLRQVFALRGAAALSKAYFPDYPPIEDADFARDGDLDDLRLEVELTEAAQEAAHDSGLRFKLHSMLGTGARFEFTGPLGRRSAAQPRLPLRFQATPLRAVSVHRPLLHPFAERCEATVRAVSLEEITAERVALMGGKPRARDVFDLWFILEHGDERLDRAATRALAEQFASEKGLVLRAEFDPAHRLLLERVWDSALRHVRKKPTFAQAETGIKEKLSPFSLRKS